jgi:hypothetical protein
MEKYFKDIDKQISFNKGKNIFLDDKDLQFRFIDETIKALSNIKELDADAEKVLTDYATDKALEEFYRVNQYYTFNTVAKNNLRKVYADLFSTIRDRQETTETISNKHYENIRQWLTASNPFAGQIYSSTGPVIEPVACAEYSAELQVDVLKINIHTMMEPVLDIGCGRQGNLVKYLSGKGINVSGIDRYSFSESNLINADWLEYDYGLEQWGTIISNLGFSNHFQHHHLRDDGSYIAYGRKYMEILKSLKNGGSFHYAPDLPFIEVYLDKKHFSVDKLDAGESGFKTTVITQIKL